MTVKRRRPVDFKIKMTPKLHQWLKSQSAENYRTMTAEINYHLERAMHKQQQEQDNDSAN